MKLHDYQEIASRQLLERTKVNMNDQDRLNNLHLMAITGAGKTVLLADYIERTFNAYLGKKNVAFVWMSIGTGGLHEQSYRALKDYLSSSIQLHTSDTFRSEQSLDHNDVLVLNWESVNRMDIDEFDRPVYNNLIMKDGEKLSLPELFENTRRDGTEIIMIIDEAHIGSGNLNKNEVKRTEIIKEEIDPKIVVNVSATPKVSEKERQSSDFIEVPTDLVINEGRIKRSVLISEDMIDSDNESFIERVLGSAVSKQEGLKELYVKSGNEHINPLGIIQIPNSKDGEKVAKVVESYLESKGYTYNKENLARAYGKELNMENVRESNNPVSFVIAKQAISTGWDAPRAQIWVKLRNIGSISFNAQTLGRILRMPEGHKVNDEVHPNYKFFEESALNNAYVYTDEAYDVDTKEYVSIFPAHKELRDDLIADIHSIDLKKESVAQDKPLISEREVKNKIEQLMDEYSDTIQNIPNHYEIGISMGGYSADALEVSDTEIEVKRVRVNHLSDIQYYSNIVLDELSKNDISEDRILNTIIAKFDKDYNIHDPRVIRLWILDNQKLLYKCVDDIRKRTKEKGKVDMYKDVEDYKFPIMTVVNKKSDGQEIFEKSAYRDQPLNTTSEPEKGFEALVDDLDNVKYWIQNGDSGKDAFSIVYEQDGIMREFYPDYVIRFTDGSVGIYEVKGDPDIDPTGTAHKERALYRYLQRMNKEGISLHGGIVYMKKDLRTDLHVLYDVDGMYPEFK